MLSFDDTRRLILEAIQTLPLEKVDLGQALGRTLAEAVRAAEDVPPFDRAMMDGFVVRIADDSPQFQVRGEIRPGILPTVQLQPGECYRIYTGAPVPSGEVRVIMQEQVRAEKGWVRILEAGSSRWIHRRGADLAAGQSLLRAWTVLGPGEVSALAALGISSVKVIRRPVVLHATSGDEIVAADAPLVPGQIRDSSSPLVRALMSRQGFGLSSRVHLPEDLDRGRALLIQAGANAADLILISGGTSVGAFDLTPALLESLGFIVRVRNSNIRPGKPLVFAERGQQVAFGLPGNPVSHYVCLLLYVLPVLEAMVHRAPGPRWLTGTLTENVEFRQDGREMFWPSQVQARGAGFEVRPLSWQVSGNPVGLIGSNALVRIQPPITHLVAGTPVEFLLAGTIEAQPNP